MVEKIGRSLLGLMLSVLVITGPAATAKGADAPAGGVQDSYLIGAGDVLTVVVWKDEEVSGSYRVRPDGRITVPLVGDVIAAGNTTDAIGMQLETKLKLFIESPTVSVIVAEAASNVVYVLGKVARPGAYQLRDRLTVLQALALAGGFTEFARENEMSLIRMSEDRQSRHAVSFKEILRSDDGGPNLLLQRGDTLVVP